jgi:lysophospholipase L1-like esterase
MANAFFPYTTPSVPSDVGATASIKIDSTKKLTLRIPDNADRIVANVSASCRMAVAAGAIPVVDLVVQNEFAAGIPVPTGGDVTVTLTPGNNRLLTITGPENTTGTLIAYNGTVVPRPWVVASSYGTAPVVGTGDWGTGATGREYLTVGNRFRIRQTGTVRKVRFGFSSLSNVTGFYVRIWRKNGTTYDLVGTSDNLAGRIVPGVVNDLELYTPIAVQVGDYVGYQIVTTGSGNFAKVVTGLSDADSYFVAGVAGATTGYAWESQSKVAGAAYPIELYIASPDIVGIGDSIMAGHASNYSMLENIIRTNLQASFVDIVAAPRGWSAQNMGIGGQTTTEIRARFLADAIALKPRYLLMNGGVNDIGGASPVNKATFLDNWTYELNQTVAAGIVPIVMAILPWTAGSNEQHVDKDDRNAALKALVATYPTAIMVDATNAVGQFRPGGAVGNKWDIIPALTADNVHFTIAGQQAIAAVISAALPAF